MRLLADRTLGRLARYLRMLGYDTVWEAAAAPEELLRRAETEQRVLLSRDTLLLERRALRRGAVRAVLVRHDLVGDQLAQLRAELGLRRIGPPRCLVCNSALKEMPAAQARGRVPPYVAATQARFTYCPGCDRVTWAATHWEDMERRLRAAGFSGPAAAPGPAGPDAPGPASAGPGALPGDLQA